MRNIIISCALVIFFSLFHTTYAGLGLAFGGRVITSQTPPVTCVGQGVISIMPVGNYPATPYAVPVASASYSHYIFSPGGWALGIYEPATVPGLCWIPGTPPIPVVTYPIIMYGTSQ